MHVKMVLQFRTNTKLRSKLVQLVTMQMLHIFIWLLNLANEL